MHLLDAQLRNRCKSWAMSLSLAFRHRPRYLTLNEASETMHPAISVLKSKRMSLCSRLIQFSQA